MVARTQRQKNKGKGGKKKKRIVIATMNRYPRNAQKEYSKFFTEQVSNSNI